MPLLRESSEKRQDATRSASKSPPVKRMSLGMSCHSRSDSCSTLEPVGSFDESSGNAEYGRDAVRRHLVMAALRHAMDALSHAEDDKENADKRNGV